MGHGHAVMGAAGWVALTAPAPYGFGIGSMEPAHIVAGAVVTAGAALLPDADHHNGTIAHSLPPISKAITRFVGQVSGGHRHATHSLFGALVVFALAWALASLRIDLRWGIADDFQIGAWVLIVLMVSFAAKALHLIRGWRTAWSISITVATAAVYFAPEQLWWLPLSVGYGAFLHVLGDWLTTQGSPWLWPLRPSPPLETPFWSNNGHFAFPILGNAGSARETALTAVMGFYLLDGLLFTVAPNLAETIVAGITT